MFGIPSPENAHRTARKRKNMEFDFAGITTPRKKNVRRTGTAAGEVSPPPVEEPAKPAAARTPAPEPTPASTPAPEPQPVFVPLPQRKPEETMALPTPTPISATRSIDRQVKEQKAISSLLHGAGLALVCTILLFAGLASLGGYVLYKQMQDQSATLALLEQNTKQRMFEMEMDLIKRDNDLAKNLEQSNLRMTALTTQFEEYRYQTTQTLAEMRARNRELEKQLSLNQRKLNDQQSVLARIR